MLEGRGKRIGKPVNEGSLGNRRDRLRGLWGVHPVPTAEPSLHQPRVQGLFSMPHPVLGTEGPGGGDR